MLHLPPSPADFGKRLAMGCGILISLWATFLLINSAFQVKETPGLLRNPGARTAATPTPESPSNAIPEPVAQLEAVFSVQPMKPQVSTAPDVADPDPHECTLSARKLARTASVPDNTSARPLPRAEHTGNGDILPAHYLERPPAGDRTLLGLLAGRQASDGILLLPKLQAGYGRLFQDSSILARGNNGTRREEPGYLYLKTCFRF